jgi:hypothetical protein
MKTRPPGMTDEVITFLDNLRDSGVTNMMGSGPYLEQEFGFTRHVAREISKYYMFDLPTV